jgi:hypothetical protein
MADQNQPQAPVVKDQQPAAPVPQAGGVQQNVPQPTTMIRPPATAEETRPAPPGTEDPRARAAALRREAAELEASAGGPATINVKIEPPHSELHFGGTFVGNDFVPVPRTRLAAIQQAADNAGVTLVTEG